MDLYVILGLGPDASAADIKRAYRRLSRRYHPGINPGDRTAEEMFTRISEAYNVLMDPRRRQEYDTGATQPDAPQPGVPQFTEFDFSVRAHGAQASTFSELFAEVLNPVPAVGTGRQEAGADLHATLAVPFDVQLTGAERRVVVTRQVPCNACQGTGLRVTAEGRCARCEGRGQTRWARGHMVFAKECAACGGTGRRRSDACAACMGHGRAVRSEAVTVRYRRVFATVRGCACRSAETPGGKAARRGICTSPSRLPRIPCSGARETTCCARFRWRCTRQSWAHGSKCRCSTDPIRLNLPPGTQGGRQFRARGRGFPTASAGAGDLIAEVRIVLPSTIDERSKELIREFGRINPGDARKEFAFRAEEPGERDELSKTRRT